MSETPIGDASAADNGLTDAPPATSPVDSAPDPSVPSSPPPAVGTDGGALAPAPASASPEPSPAPVADAPGTDAGDDTPPAAEAAASSAAPFLVKSLAEDGPVRYGFAISARTVEYDVPKPADPITGASQSEHVEYTELQVAWFDGEVGGASAETVEPAEFVQG